MRDLCQTLLISSKSRLLTFIVLLCAPLLVHAEDANIAQLFETSDVTGTIVIESVNTGQRFIHNDPRSVQAFTAASTFKVLNTLIAVEEGAVSGADTVFKWDGTPYEISAWNRDQTLESAFRVSCVWCYQILAQRVGADKYPAYIRKTHYGQLDDPFNETEFWLDGSLTISALQQAEFLKGIVRHELPFHEKSYNTLKSIMLTDASPDYRLYAKTGWATRSMPNIGWYVGYLETADDAWIFALNIDTRDVTDLPLRKQITLDALRVKGILPAT
jgi:beta-lactamase class D